MKPVISTVLAMSFCFSFALIGCSEAERIYDCTKICDKYKTCIDSDLDKGDCVDSCEDHGKDDSDFATKASDCEMCLDDKSCTEAGAKCTTTCAEVIAKST